MATEYVPRPLPVDGVQLTDDVMALVERLAEHAHDVWAAQRMSDGWCYGESRDDSAKHHPCLVSYADLPESEREYDRKVVLGTIRALFAMGFAVVRSDGSAAQ